MNAGWGGKHPFLWCGGQSLSVLLCPTGRHDGSGRKRQSRAARKHPCGSGARWGSQATPHPHPSMLHTKRVLQPCGCVCLCCLHLSGSASKKEKWGGGVGRTIASFSLCYLGTSVKADAGGTFGGRIHQFLVSIAPFAVHPKVRG